MKDVIRLVLSCLAGAIAAAIPLSFTYFLWEFCVDQVPAASEWAGVIKVVITLVIFAFGAAPTIGLAVIAFALIGRLVLAITE